MTLRIISGVMEATSCRIAVCLFQCRTCLSKVWYPTVNRFFIRNSLPSTKRKADAKCTLCCYRRPAIFYKLLSNKGSMFSRPSHGVHWKRHVHRYSTTRSSPEAMPLPNRGVLSAAPCTKGRELFNPLALELDIYSSAHHLRKMWLFYEPRRATLGNTRHFVEK